MENLEKIMELEVAISYFAWRRFGSHRNLSVCGSVEIDREKSLLVKLQCSARSVTLLDCGEVTMKWTIRLTFTTDMDI